MQLVASWLPTVDSLSAIVGNCVVVVASLVVRIKNLDRWPSAMRTAWGSEYPLPPLGHNLLGVLLGAFGNNASLLGI